MPTKILCPKCHGQGPSPSPSAVALAASVSQASSSVSARSATEAVNVAAMSAAVRKSNRTHFDDLSSTPGESCAARGVSL
jgi:hypothetical protein